MVSQDVDKESRMHDLEEFVAYEAIVDRQPVRWPDDARVAVWVVPNVEHFHADKFPGAPDIRNHSRRDYGNRVGIWRLMDVLSKHGVPGTVALNGEVIERYPRVVRGCLELGWELMGHGLTNSVRLDQVEPAEESAIIARTKELIESTGQRMRGWLGPSLAETWGTLDRLREHHVDYVADWINDDLPYRMRNGLVSIPYSIELNDMPLFNTPSINPWDFSRRIKDAFDVLHEEGARNGRVLCLALHPFLMGSPHRIKYLDEALAYMADHDHVWFATGSQIVDAYAESVTPST
jgi:peptidoglycan/xylan/chitin deacetylase (PgdA/CDA1 family)